MNRLLRDAINSLVKRHTYVMLKEVDNKVYFLISHYRYLDPEQAPAMLIGSGKLPSNSRPSRRTPGAKLLYITDYI